MFRAEGRSQTGELVSKQVPLKTKDWVCSEVLPWGREEVFRVRAGGRPLGSAVVSKVGGP